MMQQAERNNIRNLEEMIIDKQRRQFEELK